MKFIRLLAVFLLSVLAFFSINTFAADSNDANNNSLKTKEKIAFYFLVDCSPSMNTAFTKPSNTSDGRKQSVSRLESLKEQMRNYCSLMDEDANVRLYSFAKTTKEVISTSLDSDEKREKLFSAIDSLKVSNSENATWFWKALAEAYDKGKKELELTPELKKITIIVFSDGEDNDPQKPNFQADFDKSKLQKLQPVFVSIGGKAPSGLREKGVDVREAMDPEELFPIEPILRVFPNKVKAGQNVLIYSQSLGYVKRSKIDIEGVSYQESSIERVFEEPGKYKIVLTIYDSKNNEKSAEAFVEVEPKTPLKAAFKVSRNKINIGESVSFINESTGDYTSSHWTCSDGKESKENHLTRAFDKPGTYDITLTISDDKKNSSTEKKEAVVTVLTPEGPKAELWSEDKITSGDELKVFDRSYGNISKRSWLLDGNNVGNEKDLVLPTDKLDLGKHTVKLEVADEYGSSDSVEKTFEIVAIAKPTANFILPDEILINQPFQVADASQNADSIAYYIDGEPVPLSEGSTSLTFTFTEPGNKTIEQVCTNAGGETRLQHEVVVRPYDPPQVSLVVPSSTVKSRDVLNFAIAVKGDVQTIVLDIGDGSEPTTLDVTDNFTGSTSIERSFQRAQDEAIVSCKAIGRGGEDVKEATLKVLPFRSAPKAVFNIEKDRDYGAVNVKLINLSQGEGPFTFEIDNGSDVETHSFDDHKTFEKTFQGPCSLKIALIAESGDEYQPDRCEQTLTIKRDKYWIEKHLLAVSIVSILLLILTLVAIIVYRILYSRALRGTLYYRELGEKDYRSERIDKKIGTSVELAIQTSSDSLILSIVKNNGPVGTSYQFQLFDMQRNSLAFDDFKKSDAPQTYNSRQLGTIIEYAFSPR